MSERPGTYSITAPRELRRAARGSSPPDASDLPTLRIDGELLRGLRAAASAIPSLAWAKRIRVSSLDIDDRLEPTTIAEPLDLDDGYPEITVA